jgi:hypothetical protein
MQKKANDLRRLGIFSMPSAFFGKDIKPPTTASPRFAISGKTSTRKWNTDAKKWGMDSPPVGSDEPF